MADQRVGADLMHLVADVMQDGSEWTAVRLAIRLGLSRQTVTRTIRQLIVDNSVTRIGYGRYKASESVQSQLDANETKTDSGTDSKLTLRVNPMHRAVIVSPSFKPLKKTARARFFKPLETKMNDDGNRAQDSVPTDSKLTLDRLTPTPVSLTLDRLTSPATLASLTTTVERLASLVDRLDGENRDLRSDLAHARACLKSLAPSPGAALDAPNPSDADSRQSSDPISREIAVAVEEECRLAALRGALVGEGLRRTKFRELREDSTRRARALASAAAWYRSQEEDARPAPPSPNESELARLERLVRDVGEDRLPSWERTALATLRERLGTRQEATSAVRSVNPAPPAEWAVREVEQEMLASGYSVVAVDANRSAVLVQARLREKIRLKEKSVNDKKK